jgi:hypothetical protein
MNDEEKQISNLPRKKKKEKKKKKKKRKREGPSTLREAFEARQRGRRRNQGDLRGEARGKGGGFAEKESFFCFLCF